jgi:hypothetical protein
MILIVRGHINSSADKYDTPRSWTIFGFDSAKRFALCDTS